MSIIHEIPYLDTRDLNLDWLIKKQFEMMAEIERIKADAGLHGCLVKVEDYGAKGDNTTDDTDAIQRCIDENPYATIFFKEGTYRITAPISVYADLGGQMILLGGAVLRFDGPTAISQAAMISIRRRTGDSGRFTEGSSCKIIGGSLDCGNKIGWGIEQFGFHTSISYTRIHNLMMGGGGLFVGDVTGQRRESLQTKVSDLYVRGFSKTTDSRVDTTAVRVTAPDNEFSQVITDGCKKAYVLDVGGNSFINCHSTVSFTDGSGYTQHGVSQAEFDDTYHVYINPYTTNETQINTFNGCYFNVGKYVVYCALQSKMCTTLDTCFYIYYSAPNLDFSGGYGVICGGKPHDFRCTNFDVIHGGNFYMLDFFPDAQPGITSLPDHIEINSNDRHPEAPVYSAQNKQPEHDLTPIVNATNSATIDDYYEVGCVMLAYYGANQARNHTAPFKLIAYNGDVRAEYTIGFTGNAGDLKLSVLDYVSTGTMQDLELYVSANVSTVTVEGITYPIWYIYLRKRTYSNLPEFLTMENDCPFLKCYMRNLINNNYKYTGADPDNDLIRLPFVNTVYRRFLLIGDSYGLTSGGEKGWIGRMDDYLTEQGCMVVGYAEPGAGFLARYDADHHTFEELFNLHLNHVYTDIVFAGGVNDRNYAYQDIVDMIKSISDTARAFDPKIRIWIGCIGLLKDPAGEAAIRNNSYPAYLAGTLLTGNTHYLYNVQDCLTESLLKPDGIHPTPDGQEKLANAMIDCLYGQSYDRQDMDNYLYNNITYDATADLTWHPNITTTSGTVRYFQRLFLAQCRFVVGTDIAAGQDLVTLPVSYTGRAYAAIYQDNGACVGYATVINSSTAINRVALTAGTYHIVIELLI